MRLLGRDEWLVALMNPAHELRFHHRFYGEAIRTDGWRSRPNRSEAWHLIYLALEGCSTGQAARGRDISIEPGQALWLPPRAVHHLAWTPTFRYDEVWFRLLEGETDLTPLAEPMVFDAAAEARPLFDRIADELTLERQLRQQALRCLLAQLTIELFRLVAGPDGATRVDGRHRRRELTAHQRQRLLRYTQAHLADGLTAADLAREVGMSADYFTRVFRDSFGCAPRLWLTRERIRAASRLLAGSDLRIFQIAQRLGYSDVPQFSRQFKAVMGMNPQTYRQTAPSRGIVQHGADGNSTPRSPDPSVW